MEKYKCKACGSLITNSTGYCGNVVCQLAAQRNELVSLRAKYEEFISAWAQSGLADLVDFFLSDFDEDHWENWQNEAIRAHEVVHLHRELNQDQSKRFYLLMRDLVRKRYNLTDEEKVVEIVQGKV